MRLFTAVSPPVGARAELAAAVASLHALPGARRLRWTDAAGWHLALAFYGDVPETTVPDLRAHLAHAAGHHPRARLSLAGAGHFGRRVLWAGVTGDTAPLARLADAATAAARRAGHPMAERRPYHPHLTLARNAADVELAPFAAALDDFTGRPWTADELTLMRSHLPPPGVPGGRPRHEPLDRWRLGV
jgi:2'-5' RNA ligase